MPLAARIRFDLLRGSNQLALDIPVTVLPRPIDQLAALADPAKSFLRPLGILGIDATPAIARQMGGLRGKGGVLVLARAAGSGQVPLESGDVVLSVNGVAVGSVEDLRAILDGLPAEAAVALQIQRNEALSYSAFTLPKS